MCVCVFLFVVSADKSEGGGVGRGDGKDGGVQGGGGGEGGGGGGGVGGLKRSGQFGGDKTPDPKRKRT